MITSEIMKKVSLICSLYVLTFYFANCQKFNKNDFFEADMALVSGNYEQAQKIFGRLLLSEPENANLNFLNGLCLINIPGRKKESLRYFEVAAPKSSPEYEYGNPEEVNAPVEVIKYYGMASKLNNNITLAIDLLNNYKLLLGSKEKDEVAMADALIEECYMAIQLQAAPVYYRQLALGDNLLSSEKLMYPVVNNDETMLFYAMKGDYDRYDIFFSRKSDNVWGTPVKITALLGAKGECYPTSVSFDNTRLYLTEISATGSDIFYSSYSKDRWQKMVKLDKPVNGGGWDSHAYESADGKYLYFSSDRKGGFGNMDLYRSEMDEKGSWMKPLNLGETINSSRNELMPAVNADHSKLFFKSEAHQNLGGYDLFVSDKLDANEWSQPRNFGYPVNTTDDDIYSIPVRNGDFVYAAIDNTADGGVNSISMLEVFSENHPRKFYISGNVTINGSDQGTGNIKIEVFNSTNYEKLISLSPELQTNNYFIELASGSYMINFTGPDYKTYSQTVELPKNYPEDIIILNAIMEKESAKAEVIPAVAYIAETDDKILPVAQPAKEPEVTLDSHTDSYEERDASPTGNYSTAISTESKSGYEGKYTIQFMASLHPVDGILLAGRYPVEVQKGDDGYYRYITGVFDSPELAEKIRTEIADIKYRQAFIRFYSLEVYLGSAAGKSNTLYTIQLSANQHEVDITDFKGLTNIRVSLGDDKLYRYTTGSFSSLSAAQKDLQTVIAKGYPKAYIKKISDVSNYH
jgi:hypothetical protein